MIVHFPLVLGYSSNFNNGFFALNPPTPLQPVIPVVSCQTPKPGENSFVYEEMSICFYIIVLQTANVA